ncbi:MAG: hypothetical protein EOO77_30475 [Oxalobacteraceae bacterium]|nr:MAG: hypothetical protein EOO77_30475 [Oxalobacteraceae bacterium]
MKVEVVELRKRGKKLSAVEEVTAMQLTRVGYLMLFGHQERSGQRSVIARLLPRPTELVVSLFEQLEDVQINALRGNQFVLAGIQHERHGDKSYGVFPQAWLCKVLDIVSSDQQMP